MRAELGGPQVSWIQLSWNFLIKVVHARRRSLHRHRWQYVCSALNPSSVSLDITGWHPALSTVLVPLPLPEAQPQPAALPMGQGTLLCGAPGFSYFRLLLLLLPPPTQFIPHYLPSSSRPDAEVHVRDELWKALPSPLPIRQAQHPQGTPAPNTHPEAGPCTRSRTRMPVTATRIG